ncbi:hypothetical protein HDV57DRAFT_502917 [Trichoderma longibrachiatum]
MTKCLLSIPILRVAKSFRLAPVNRDKATMPRVGFVFVANARETVNRTGRAYTRLESMFDGRKKLHQATHENCI